MNKQFKTASGMLNSIYSPGVSHLKSGMYLLELKVSGIKEGTVKITILQ